MTIHATHLAKPVTISTVMLKVLLALLPGIALSVHFYGVGVLIQLALATLTAAAAEAAMLRLRGIPALPMLKDLSAVVTAWLLALSLPPLASWWLIVVATLFAIVIAKQLYGGLGQNPFNPAMVGVAVVLVSFPAHLAAWGTPLAALDATAQWQWIFSHTLAASATPDAISSATPLDGLRTGLLQGTTPVTTLLATDPQWASRHAAASWIGLGWLAGGLWLWQQRLIAWQAPLAMLAGVVLTASMLWGLDPARHASPLFHLTHGATLMAAAFIVTDPVSGSTTPRGRLLFGFAVGVLTIVIRRYGNFPDGVAFAVLILNIAVPFIDRYTQPRVFGRKGKRHA